MIVSILKRMMAFITSLRFAPATHAVIFKKSTVEIAYLSASEQIELFKKGILSPVDVVKAQILMFEKHNGKLNNPPKKIENYRDFNGKVNAVTHTFFPDALIKAKIAESRYKNGTARTLEGVTIAIKDVLQVNGWPISKGTTLLGEIISNKNDPVAERLLDEGAILSMQTTVPEFFLDFNTWSSLWGGTRNPWSLKKYTSGGSSGGSGAAVAAGFATMSIGSDAGGSIRLPAAVNGLFTIKAPFGRVPTSENSYKTYGPMTRTFNDLILLQNVISGPHPDIAASLAPKLAVPYDYPSLKGVKIAVDYSEQWIPSIDPEVKKAIEHAVKILREEGAIVDIVNLKLKSENIIPNFLKGVFSTSSGSVLTLILDNNGKVDGYVQATIDSLSKINVTKSKYIYQHMTESSKAIGFLNKQVQNEVFLKGYSALLTPTFMSASIPADFNRKEEQLSINGIKVLNGFALMNTPMWNMLSNYPVINIPVGISDKGVPIGMQIIADKTDDLSAFAVAHGYVNSSNGLKLFENAKFPTFQNSK